jgi:hypothetical protein
MAIYTLKEMREGTTISKKTLVLAQRPQITVRAFYFSEAKGVGSIPDSPAGIYGGSFCSGQFHIQNIGGTDARIREIWQDIYIGENLPMKRPYDRVGFGPSRRPI